jgi:hypothetical protein
MAALPASNATGPAVPPKAIAAARAGRTAMSYRCISCGMPMEKAADHAMGDETKGYCLHCARPDGTMKSYQEALDFMSAFIVRTEGRNEEAAREKARAWMARQPAWKDRQEG